MTMEIRHDGVHIKGPHGGELCVGMDGDIYLVNPEGNQGMSWSDPEDLFASIMSIRQGPDTNPVSVRDLLVEALGMIDKNSAGSDPSDVPEEKGQDGETVDTGAADVELVDGLPWRDGDFLLIEDPQDFETAVAIAQRVAQDEMDKGLERANIQRVERYQTQANALRPQPEESFQHDPA